MAKNRKTPDMNLPVWFDGQNINEALFCEEFLQESRIIFANRAFFTPNIAPGIDPMPPNTAAVKALMPGMAPVVGRM